MESSKEIKPVIDEKPQKSSMEILSELFSSFNAEAPVIVKKEKTEKKHKKSKKKHKHKDKKHKKKDKKKKKDTEGSSTSSDESEIDLAQILIKQEKEANDKKIKIEGTDLSFNLEQLKVKKEKKEDSEKGTKRKHSPHSEEGEVSDSDGSKSKHKKRKKHKHKSDTDSKKSSSREKRHRKSTEDKEEDKGRKHSGDKVDDRGRKHERRGSRERRHSNSKSKDRSRERFERSLSLDKNYKSYDRCKEDSREYYNQRRENPFYRRHEFYGGSRCRDYDKEDRNRQRVRDRYRERSRERHHRSRTPDDNSSYIDKKKLLEIARRNAIQMMKSGSLPGALTLGPQAQEKVIAAIKAGGKTIEELTDFCKTLSKQEELGELSSNEDDNGSGSDADKPFHHPFQIKDRPTTITMNIRNSVPLPIKSTQERTSELRIQFPVSSGQHHRKTESEWVPVAPKKTESTPLAITAPPVAPDTIPEVVPTETPALPGPQIFPAGKQNVEMTVDIGSIVSQRLTAMRRLQENPNDVQALTQMYQSNKEMQSWAQSKQQPGQFTGSTGANIMSTAELTSGYQAWAKKDQLQSAQPVSGGMGMHLLQKMGWKPGEGLGKEKTGALEPLLLEVKLDKKGLVANEETNKRKPKQKQNNVVKSVQGKHPVSLLGEYSTKAKLGPPQYELCFECGPDHKKNFLFKVIVNGVEYKPNIASPNKKEAKASAATLCLQKLGVLPS